MTLLESAKQISISRRKTSQKTNIGPNKSNETLDLAIGYVTHEVTAGMVGQVIGIQETSVPNWVGQEFMRRFRDGMLIRSSL